MSRATWLASWFVIAPLIALHTGCDGGSAACAQPMHPLCTANVGSRVVGEVVEVGGDRFAVRVEEVTGPLYEEQISYGPRPGELVAAPYPAGYVQEVAVGESVWLFGYFPQWPSSEGECPEWEDCHAACRPTMSGDPDGSAYRDCINDCNAMPYECGPRSETARLNGRVTAVALAGNDGVLDFGEDYLGPVRLPLSELETIDTFEECEARLPIPDDATYEPEPLFNPTTEWCVPPYYDRVDPWDV